VAEVPDGPVHCDQHPFGAPLDASEILVSNQVEPALSSDWRRVAEIVVPDSGGDLCGSDVALVALATSVPHEVARPASPALDAPPESGQSYVAVGYGATNDGAGASYGERRARGGLRVECGTADSCLDATVTSTEFVGEAGVCSGDSGGPALTPEGEVLGVASRSTEGCSHPVYSALYPWRAWLVAGMERLGQRTTPAPNGPSRDCSFAGDSGGSALPWAAPQALLSWTCAWIALLLRSRASPYRDRLRVELG
jgi:hypothetical protein